MMMETISFPNDISLLCVTAESFPDGVMEAHRKLRMQIPVAANRKYFGISRPENGSIVYKAAAEKISPEEMEKPGLTEQVLKQGKYICIAVTDFMKNIPVIGAAFNQLLAVPGIDPMGYCVEWYVNENDVTCMVRLKD